MRSSLKTGFSFGLTSGIITTLGLIVGLDAGTHSEIAVVGGVLTIAIADAFSDALGIHVSQESQDGHSSRFIWESTVATFLTKFIFALTFLPPLLFFELSKAILISVVWGFLTLFIFSFIIAKEQKKNPWKAAIEHLLIGILVVLITRFIGDWVVTVFN